MLSNSSLPERWLRLAIGFAILWAVAYGFGRVALPLVQSTDQAISAAVNPDQYLPFVDEFFRALTDHTNFLIAVPLISLAIAVGLFRLTQMPANRALTWAAGSYAAWCLLFFALNSSLELRGSTVYVLLALPLLIIVVGAGVPRGVTRFEAKSWITGMLTAELLIFVVLWFLHRLFWNEGLVGANYVLLPAVIGAFGGAAWMFYKMDDSGMRRYTRVFWLVLLASLLVDMLATNQTKSAIGRPRPLSEKNAPWNEALRAIPEETLRGSNSFPSGHTSGTFALLTPLFWWVRDRRARAGILGWGVLQGVSRVYTVAHFTTDCLIGGMLGFGTGTLVFFLLGGPGLRGHLVSETEPMAKRTPEGFVETA